MIKKILIIILVILLISATGLFIWAFSISKNSGGEITVTESVKEIVSFGKGGENNIFNFRLGDDFNTGLLGGNTDKEENDTELLSLRKIAPIPITGVSVFENKNKDTVIRFISRENGHIFETLLNSNTQKRISNTTILRIWDALWLPDNNSFITRFLNNESDEINTFYAEIKTNENIEKKNDNLPAGGEKKISNTEGSIEGIFLQNEIIEPIVSKSKEKIFYLIPNGVGVVGIISKPDGSAKAQVFVSPISEWRSQWPEGDKIALTTKPSANISGFMYFLNINTEEFEKIISDKRGLTTLTNEERTKTLFSHNKAGKLLLSILDIKSKEITELPIWTMAEKCIWSNINSSIIYCAVPNIIPIGESLDLWYQGLVSFSDSIWVIDTETQTANMLMSPEDYIGENIDMINLTLSPNEDYLFFTNKEDSNLWQLKIERQ